MAFDVHAGKLRSFGTWIDTMVDENEKAVAYSHYLRVDDGGGQFLLRLIPSLDDIYSTAEACFRQLRNILDASASEILATAQTYEDTDLATAATLEETYPR